MRILDRYIIRQFLMNTIIIAFVLTGLFVLVDFIIDVDEFLKAGRSWAEQQNANPTQWQIALSTLAAIWDFYMPMVVLLYVFFCGLFVVAGSGFTLANLIRTRELVAMVTGGISMFRIAMPMILTGFVVIAATLPLQEYVVPKLAARLARPKSQLRYGTLRTFPVYFVPDGKGALLSAATFDINQPQPQLSGVTIVERDERGWTRRRIIADAGQWDAARGGWHLDNGFSSKPPEPTEGDLTAGSLALADDIQAIDFYPSAITPDVLLAKRESIYVRLLSLQELIRLRSNPAANQPLIAQVLWSRFSMLVVNVLILVMALPLFLLREPGNMLIQAAKAAALTMGAWGGALVMLQIGTTTLNPVTAAWLPVVVYLPLSAVLLMTVKT